MRHFVAGYSVAFTRQIVAGYSVAFTRQIVAVWQNVAQMRFLLDLFFYAVRINLL